MTNQMKLEILKEKHKIHVDNIQKKINFNEEHANNLANEAISGMLDAEIELLDQLLGAEKLSSTLIDLIQGVKRG